MLQYDYVVDPSEAVGRLTTMGERAENSRPAFTKIRDRLLKDQRENFESRGGTFDEKWPATSKQTMMRKHEREGNPGSILVATGELAAAAKGGKGKFTRITKSQVRVGINKRIFVARFHQAGAPKGSRRGTLPKRTLVGITDESRRFSVTLLAKWIEGA